MLDRLTELIAQNAMAVLVVLVILVVLLVMSVMGLGFFAMSGEGVTASSGGFDDGGLVNCGTRHEPFKNPLVSAGIPQPTLLNADIAASMTENMEGGATLAKRIQSLSREALIKELGCPPRGPGNNRGKEGMDGAWDWKKDEEGLMVSPAASNTGGLLNDNALSKVMTGNA